MALVFGIPTIIYTGVIVAINYFGCDSAVKSSFAATSIDRCIQFGGLSETQCRAQYQQAQTAHALVAPRFADMSACEAAFGVDQCRSESSADSAMDKSDLGSLPETLYVPELAGFLVGIHQRYNVPMEAQPIYPVAQATGFSGYRTLDGLRLAALDAPVPLTQCYYWPNWLYIEYSSDDPRRRRPVNDRAVVERRGGFGNTGHGFGSVGG